MHMGGAALHQVATRTVAIAFSDQENTTIKNLSPAAQQALDSLNGIITTVNSAVGAAQNLEEITDLDLRQLIEQLPLTTNVDFYLSSVKGLSQYPQNGSYVLTATGLGFGTPPGREKYTVGFTIDGHNVPASAILNLPGHDTRITVPHDLLDGKFPDTTPIGIKAILNTTVSRPSSCIGNWCLSTSTTTYSTPLQIMLLPKTAAVLSGKQTISQRVETISSSPKQLEHDTDHCHPGAGACDWHQSQTLSPDEVAVSVTMQHSGAGCPFDYVLRAHPPGHEYDPDFEIGDNGHVVTVYRHNDGDAPCHVTHYITYKTIENKPSDKPLGPFNASFNQPLPIDLDPANPNCSYRLTGKFFTGQSPYIDSGMTQSADGLIRRISSINIGDHCSVTLLVITP
jgi:hypothetical protein